MGFHTFDLDRADALEDESRYRYVSVDELLALFEPRLADVVADLGSGTGFYTDDVAPEVARCYAVDVQAGMHEYYREKGAPDNVEFLTCEVADLPLPDDTLDGAVSTMTFHEFADADAMVELARVLAPGALLGVADWSANGRGDAGPPRGETYSLEAAAGLATDAGFDVEHATERRETFVLSARLG
jgi:ubiquinone/menaquinone biosynthesis C-methylase UbiE